jgi:hypothetical protein
LSVHGFTCKICKINAGCVEKSCLHKPSGAEKQTKTKTANKTQTVLWQPQNQNHHTKEKTQSKQQPTIF